MSFYAQYFRHAMITQNMGIVSSRMMHSMMQLSLATDNPLRQQLENMAQRGQRISSLPPVPEPSTPSECSLVESVQIENSLNDTNLTPAPLLSPATASTGVNNPMSTSLFQEFSNRQLRQQG